jgi:hypothetical protein
MTTMAALTGTLPIALGWGAGAEARRPLGLAVVGGLLVSQTLTLYVTPVYYVYLQRLQERFGRQRAVVAGPVLDSMEADSAKQPAPSGGTFLPPRIVPQPGGPPTPETLCSLWQAPQGSGTPAVNTGGGSDRWPSWEIVSGPTASEVPRSRCVEYGA